LVEGSAYNYCLNLLSRREYSEAQMLTKLQQKFRQLSVSDLRAVMEKLRDADLLSDLRFAEVLIRSRINRGYGPFYIRQELAAKGIASETGHRLLEAAAVDWQTLATDIVARRHTDAHSDPQVWRKAARFLQRRGFSGEIVSKALGPAPREFA